MGHDHDHSAMEGYFLDQICTVAACGLLGGISFLIWKIDLLTRFNILTEQFTRPVLVGGIGLIVIAMLRAVSLWSAVGQKHAGGHSHSHDHDHDHHHHEHEHEHDHGHDHDHSHACDHSHAPGEACDHDHGHDHQDHNHDHVHGHSHDHAHDHAHEHTHVHTHEGHDHGFAPWRYAVLLLPLMLSGLLIYYHFQGLQLQYSKEWLVRIGGGKDPALVESGSVAEKTDGERVVLGFKELNDIAMERNPDRREFFQGRVGELRGLFNPISENQFTLFRLRMTCCASDAVPLKIRIISPVSLIGRGLQPGKGVSVTGKIEFRKVVDRDQYVPVMVLKDANDVHAEDIGNDIYDKGS